MTRKIALIIFFSLVLCVPSYAARFSGLKGRLNTIASKNYGKQVMPGYSIAISFIDIRTGYKVSVRGNRLFPAASIIKLPVMACLFHMTDIGSIDAGEKIPFTEADKLPGAGVLQWLKPNSYTLWNLCRMMISLSDNSATRLVINRLGMPAINNYCRSIGLKSTKVTDETALIESPDPRKNITTANDIARLLYRIERGAGFTKSSRKEMISFMLNQRYRFGIPKVLPKDFKCANKTGNHENLLHDAAIVYSKRGNYILVVFTKGFRRLYGHDRYARLVINDVSEAVAGYYR